jgi:hypothetical protein
MKTQANAGSVVRSRWLARASYTAAAWRVGTRSAGSRKKRNRMKLAQCGLNVPQGADAKRPAQVSAGSTTSVPPVVASARPKSPSDGNQGKSGHGCVRELSGSVKEMASALKQNAVDIESHLVLGARGRLRRCSYRGARLAARGHPRTHSSSAKGGHPASAQPRHA